MRKPDQDSSKYIPITQEMINQLLELKKKTGVGYHALYKYGREHTNHEVFKKTTDALPNMWVIGKVRAVNSEYYNSIIETYKKIPECHRGGCYSNNIEVTEDFRSKLKAFIDTPRNLSIKKLLLYTNAPDRLTPTLISNIANGKTMSTKIEYDEYLKQLMGDLNDRNTLDP